MYVWGLLIMSFEKQGYHLRQDAKKLVLEFMSSNFECSSKNPGMRQANIFRSCGFDWGEKENATSSNQQYWVVALLRELESEGKIQRDPTTKLWRLI